MNTKKLSAAIREMARAIHDDGCGQPSTARVTTADTSELLRVLANLVDGKPMARSFGAPGDWGYGTPIGDALASFDTADAASATNGAK